MGFSVLFATYGVLAVLTFFVLTTALGIHALGVAAVDAVKTTAELEAARVRADLTISNITATDQRHLQVAIKNTGKVRFRADEFSLMDLFLTYRDQISGEVSTLRLQYQGPVGTDRWFLDPSYPVNPSPGGLNPPDLDPGETLYIVVELAPARAFTPGYTTNLLRVVTPYATTDTTYFAT